MHARVSASDRPHAAAPEMQQECQCGGRQRRAFGTIQHERHQRPEGTYPKLQAYTSYTVWSLGRPSLFTRSGCSP